MMKLILNYKKTVEPNKNGKILAVHALRCCDLFFLAGVILSLTQKCLLIQPYSTLINLK